MTRPGSSPSLALRPTGILVVVLALLVSSPVVARPGSGSPPDAGASSTDRTETATRAPEGRSLLGAPLMPLPRGPENEPLEQALADARVTLAARPGDPEAIIWVGRRLGYLWRMREAIDVYTDGLRRHPDHAAMLRHRGHRFISIRRFDEAIADLQRATGLIEGKPDVIEPDGMPNAANIPLTTLGFNVWYHLALARYLEGDDPGAVAAWRRCLDFTGGHDDNLVAVSDWLYLALRRMGRHDEAARLLDPITPDLKILENHAYHRRLLLYKGVVSPEDLTGVGEGGALDLATLGYGLGCWYDYNGRSDLAVETYRQVVERGYWPAFGTIAAEAALARLESHGPRDQGEPDP